MNNKVGVVILTYNRLNLLKITICKVMAQTYKPLDILIVDNNSTDGTKEFLNNRDDVKSLFLAENLGPAGGFYEGIKYFAENTNVDYVWLMDDDFFPFDSCLQILLENTNSNKIVYPYVREKDFATRLKPGWWGVLVPMPVVKKVGYPRKDLFFWAEDSEYLQTRITHQYNIPSDWISSAKGVHFTQRVTNYRQPWRYYYEIRNSIYSRLYIKKTTRKQVYKIFRSWIKLFASILIKEDNKFEKLKWFFRGTSDGLFKRLGKRKELHNG